MGSVSLLISLIYTCVGSMAIKKMHNFFKMCSSQISPFIIVSASLMGLNLLRFFMIFYRLFFNKKIMPDALFQTLCYFIPDFFEVLIILWREYFYTYSIKQQTHSELEQLKMQDEALIAYDLEGSYT